MDPAGPSDDGKWWVDTDGSRYLICWGYAQDGNCERGDECPFAHGWKQKLMNRKAVEAAAEERRRKKDEKGEEDAAMGLREGERDRQKERVVRGTRW